MGYRFFIYISLVLLFSGCKKYPEIIHPVLDIKAGDSTSPDVHYVRAKSNLNGWSIINYYLDIDNRNPHDFDFSLTGDNHSTYQDINFTVQPVGLNKSVFICVDSSGYPVNFQFGKRITDSLKWVNNTGPYCLYDYYWRIYSGQQVQGTSGNWAIQTNGYLAFKIIDSKTSLTYKGWIRVGQGGYIDNYAYVFY